MYGLIIDTPRIRCNQYKNLFLFCLFACFIVSLSFFFLYCFYFHFIFYFLFVGGIVFCHETILDHLLLPMDTDGRLRTNLFDKEDHFNFPIVNFPFIFQQHLHMEYISLNRYDIPELVIPISISLIESCY